MLKKIVSIALPLILIFSVFNGCSKAEYSAIERVKSDNITTVTFNCAAPWGNLLKGTSSSARVKRFAEYMNVVKPDSIGTQEMNSKWLDKLKSLMSDYDSYGVARGGDENENKSEMNAVFWRKDKYTAAEKGTFWLSETPEKESKYEGAGCNRICTWVLLELKDTNNPLFIHMNTHLDNASEEAANYGAEVIVQKIDELTAKYGVPIVLTGDFNETRGMQAYNTVSKRLYETGSAITGSPETEKATYHAWGEEQGNQPIDFIFISQNKSVANYKILDDVSNGYVSDHYGAYTEWSLYE